MEVAVAYYALHKFHWTPSQVCSLSRQELAFVYAAIEKKRDADKEAEKKAPKIKKGRRRRR